MSVRIRVGRIGPPATAAMSTGSFYDLDIATEDAVAHLADMGVVDVEVFLQGPAELEPLFVRELADRCDVLGAPLRVRLRVPPVHRLQQAAGLGYLPTSVGATSTSALSSARPTVCHGPPRRHVRHVRHDETLDNAYCERRAALMKIAARRGLSTAWSTSRMGS